MIIVVPIFLGMVGLGSFGTKFSIYNEGWDGLSSVRLYLEQETTAYGQKYEILNGMSSLNILNRFNRSAVVTVIGPATKYSQADTISMIAFLARGGSLIIADDYGTGSEIFEPLFNLLETWDDVASVSGGSITSLSELFGNATQEGGDLIFTMIAGMLKGIGFNNSVLMDAESYTTNPAQPLLTEFEGTNPLTSGITKGVQMEFGTVISIKMNHSVYIDQGVPQTVKIYQPDWMPMQAVSLSLFGRSIEDQFLPFLPFYTSKSAWLESDFNAAKEGTATPDEDEWGNVKFAPMMTLPIGNGKIIMIGDPDIFINKWIEKTDDNDNLRFCQNLFDYATQDLNMTTGEPYPIIFDEGHVHQKFYSASIYSMTLMRFITEMSMFPLYAPFIPIFIAVLAYPLIPKKTRLTPVLWTKYRGEAGKSRFEREIRRITETGAFKEAISLLYRALLRGARKISGSPLSTPKEVTEFFLERDPSLKVKNILPRLRRIEAFLGRPRLLKETEFLTIMTFIKDLMDRIS